MDSIIVSINHAAEVFARNSLQMLLQSSVLILFLAALDWVLRNRVRAIVRYWLWMLLLIKLVLPANLSLPTGFVSMPSLQEDHPRTGMGTFSPSQRSSGVEKPRFPATPNSPSNLIERLDSSPSPNSLQLRSARKVEKALNQLPVRGLSFLGWLFIGWASCAAVLTGVAVRKTWQLRGLVRRCAPAGEELERVIASCSAQIGIRPRAKLRISEGKLTPALCGIFRPCILLPDELVRMLKQAELRSILLHELVHLKRQDVLVNIAQTVLQIIYFYHPLLWLGNARIRRLREDAVDECVLVALGAEAELYPVTLLDVARMTVNARALSFGTVGIIESRSALATRIRRMLSRPFPKNARLGAVGSMTVLSLAFCLLPMGTRAREEKRPSAPAPTSAREFLAKLQYYPDPMFPEYKSVTNRIADTAEDLLPLILQELKKPLANPPDLQTRLARGTKIWALGLMGEKAKAAIPALVKEIENDDLTIPQNGQYGNYTPAFWAASALGEIGPAASNAVPSLIESAHFGNYKAVPALARIVPNSSEVVALAIETFNDLSKGNGGNVSGSRLAGLEALTVLADKPGKARETLLRAVEDSDPPIRTAAAKFVLTSKLPGADTVIDQSLKSDDVTKVNTATALAHAGDKSERVRQGLLEGLNSPLTRLRAIEGFTSLAPLDPALIPVLLPLLKEPELAVRLAAVQLLTRFPQPQNPALLQAVLPLLDENNPELRRNALQTIAQNGLVTPKVIQVIRQALQSSNDELFQIGLQSAEALKAPELAPDMVRLFQDTANVDRLRDAHANVLATMRSYPDAALPLLPEITRELNGEQGWAAAIALMGLGTNAASAVPALIEVIQGTNQGTVIISVQALGKIGAPARSSIPILAKISVRAEPMVQLNAAVALWRIDRQQHVVAILKDRLESEEHWDRLSLINAVSSKIWLLDLVKELGPDAAPLSPIVQRYLKDENPGLRAAATEALAAMGPTMSTPHASSQSTKTNDELFTQYKINGERSRSSQGLIVAELLRRPGIVEFLLGKLRKDVLMNDTPNRVLIRVKAAFLLAHKGTDAVRAVPALLACLEDDEEVRRAATECLGRIGPNAKQVVPILLEELSFQNSRAATALARIAPNSGEVQDAIVNAVMAPARSSHFRSESLAAMRFMTVRTKKLADALVELSTDEDDHVKEAALRLQGKLSWIVYGENSPLEGKTEKDIPDLIASIRRNLKEKTSEAQNAAVAELNALSVIATNSDEALDLFIGLLEQETYISLGNLLYGIGNQGARAARAVPLLIRLIRQDDRTGVEFLVRENALAESAIMTLGRIGPAAIEARETLLELIETEDFSLRWQAANALRQINPQESDRWLPILLAPFRNGDEDIHPAEIFVAGELGSRAAKAVPRLLELLEADEASRLFAAVSLPKIDSTYRAKAIRTLIETLEDPNVLNPHAAAERLGSFGRFAVDAIPSLREASKNTNNAWLQREASAALIRIQQDSRQSL